MNSFRKWCYYGVVKNNQGGTKMKEVYPNLYVGTQADYERNQQGFKEWKVVHTCKEPYHRKALGYKGRGAPKESPYYFYLYDANNHLILNIVDTDSPEFFNDEMIDEAVKYCIDGLKTNRKVLVHCNQGESRAPSLVLLLLRRIGHYNCSFEEAVEDFKTLYPGFNPKRGIFTYVRNRWYENNN